MLWVDTDPVTLDDLLSVEAELSDIASVEKLTLEGNLGLIRRAKEQAQTHLAQFMSFGSNLSLSDLAVRNVNTPAYMTNRTLLYAGFAQLVVSGDTEYHWSPLKQWLVDRTLREVYRAATNRNGDRYQTRFDDINDKISSESWPRMRRFGLPLVINPLPCPGAIMERSGSFGAINVSTVAGSGTSTDEIDVAVTWTSAEFPVKQSESYRSAVVPVTLVNAQVLRVSLVGLTSPDGQQPDYTQASSRYSTRVATGWNVYVGKRGSQLYRQNSTPLGLEASYTASGNPVYSGIEAGLGQYADINLEITSSLRRC